MSLSKNLRSFNPSDPPQAQYQNYLLEKPQKSYLSTSKNLDFKDYKPLSRPMAENMSFESKQTPTNPSFKPHDFDNFSNNKYSSKSLNKDLKYSDFGSKPAMEKKEKDADLSVKLKDKREIDIKMSKGLEKSKNLDSFDLKYEKFNETKGADVMGMKDKSRVQDKRLEKKYEQYLKDSPEKISDRKKKKGYDDFKKPNDESYAFKKQYEESLGMKKTFDAKKDLDFWNEKLEKYSQKDLSYQKVDISHKKQEKKPEKQELNFQKESEYIKELKKSLYSKEKEPKATKIDDLDKKLNEKMRLNFDEKNLFMKPEGFIKKDWTFNIEEKPSTYKPSENKSIKQDSYAKYDALKPQKPEISAKKTTNEEKYKDLIKPSSYQDIKKPEFKNEKYTQKPIESYEKKLFAEEKPEEKKPNIYQQFEFEREKEKLKKPKESVELKSHDSNAIEALRKKKDDLELQVKDLTQKLNVVQNNNLNKQNFQDLENRYKDSQKELFEIKNQNEDFQNHFNVLNNQIADLKQNSNRLESEKQQLRASNEKYQRENQEIFKLQADIKNIKAEVTKEQKIKESLLGDLKLSEDRKKQLETNIKEANNQIEDFKIYKDRLEKTEKSRIELNNQVKILNEELAKMKKKANDTAEIEIIKEELEKVKTEHSKSNKMNQNLQGQLQETSSKYEEMQKALIDEIDGMKENQEKLLDENRDLAQKIGDLNEQYNHFVEEFNEKEQEYIKEIQDLKGNENPAIQQEELLEIFKGFEEEKAEIIKKYHELEKDHIELLSKSNYNENSQQEFENLRKISQDLEVKLAEERNNYENIIKENEDLQKNMRLDLQSINEELEKVRDTNIRLTQENERILSEYDALQMEVENIGKMNAHYEETMQKLQDDNTAMAQYLEKQDQGKDSNEDFHEKMAQMEENHHKELEILQKEIEDLHEIRVRLEKLLEEKTQNENLFEGKIQELVLEKEGLEEENQNLKTKFELAMNQLEAIKPNNENIDDNEEEKDKLFEQKEQEYVNVIENLQKTHDENIAEIQMENQRKTKEIEKEYQEKIRKLEQELSKVPVPVEENKENDFDIIPGPGESEENLNRYITLVKEKEEMIEELKEKMQKSTTLLNEKDEKLDELIKELAKKDQNLKETVGLIVSEYEEKHMDVLLKEKEKFELLQEKFLRKIESLRQENEVFREHIMNNPQLLENKENKNPKAENSEMQAIPFLVEEYEFKYKMALDAEREKFKVIEEKYIKKVQDLQELLMNPQNY